MVALIPSYVAAFIEAAAITLLGLMVAAIMTIAVLSAFNSDPNEEP